VWYLNLRTHTHVYTQFKRRLWHVQSPTVVCKCFVQWKFSPTPTDTKFALCFNWDQCQRRIIQICRRKTTGWCMHAAAIKCCWIPSVHAVQIWRGRALRSCFAAGVNWPFIAFPRSLDPGCCCVLCFGMICLCLCAACLCRLACVLLALGNCLGLIAWITAWSDAFLTGPRHAAFCGLLWRAQVHAKFTQAHESDGQTCFVGRRWCKENWFLNFLAETFLSDFQHQATPAINYEFPFTISLRIYLKNCLFCFC